MFTKTILLEFSSPPSVLIRFSTFPISVEKISCNREISLKVLWISLKSFAAMPQAFNKGPIAICGNKFLAAPEQKKKQIPQT